MREIRWLKAADDELADIVNYVLNTHGQNTALQVYDEIIHRIELLAEFPELGTSETQYCFHGMPLRVLHSKLTKVFYCVLETEIIIVLLWSNRMDDRKLKDIIEYRN